MKHIIVSVVMMILLFSTAADSFSAQADNNQAGGLEWVPLPLDETNRIRLSNLSDEEKIKAYVRLLDSRITLTSVENPPGHRYPTSYKPDPAVEYSYLIRLMAKEEGPADAPGRPKAVNTVLGKLDQMSDIRNKDQVRIYLQIALAVAGGNAPESTLLRLLNDESQSWIMFLLVMEAMRNSHVPIRALPRLIELTSDPYNFVTDNSIGVSNPRRVFPIRDASYETILELGVKAEKRFIEDEQIDPKRGVRLKSTVIEISRASLLARLRMWLSSGDEAIWRAAIGIVQQIHGADVQAMLVALLKGNELSEEKKQVLEQAIKARTQEPAKVQ